jgi:hypothetical protein
MTGAKPMSENKQPKQVQRRGFFATFGLGGAAAVVASVSTVIVAAPEPAQAMTPSGGKAGPHYTESEHIKKFYRENSY